MSTNLVRFLFLICIVHRVLYAENELTELDHLFEIVLQDLETLDLDDFRHNSANITGFRLINRSSPKVQDTLQQMALHQKQAGSRLLNSTNFLLIKASNWPFIVILNISGVATGGISGSGPPTYIQTPLEISAKPLKSLFLYIEVGVPCMYIVTCYCSTAKKNCSDPFFGLATPLLNIGPWPCLLNKLTQWKLFSHNHLLGKIDFSTTLERLL